MRGSGFPKEYLAAVQAIRKEMADPIDPPTKIVVVGAGPVGLATGIMLALGGATVTVLEAANDVKMRAQTITIVDSHPYFDMLDTFKIPMQKTLKGPFNVAIESLNRGLLALAAFIPRLTVQFSSAFVSFCPKGSESMLYEVLAAQHVENWETVEKALRGLSRAEVCNDVSKLLGEDQLVVKHDAHLLIGASGRGASVLRRAGIPQVPYAPFRRAMSFKLIYAAPKETDLRALSSLKCDGRQFLSIESEEDPHSYVIIPNIAAPGFPDGPIMSVSLFLRTYWGTAFLPEGEAAFSRSAGWFFHAKNKKWPVVLSSKAQVGEKNVMDFVKEDLVPLVCSQLTSLSENLVTASPIFTDPLRAAVFGLLASGASTPNPSDVCERIREAREFSQETWTEMRFSGKTLKYLYSGQYDTELATDYLKQQAALKKRKEEEFFQQCTTEGLFNIFTKNSVSKNADSRAKAVMDAWKALVEISPSTSDPVIPVVGMGDELRGVYYRIGLGLNGAMKALKDTTKNLLELAKQSAIRAAAEEEAREEADANMKSVLVKVLEGLAGAHADDIRKSSEYLNSAVVKPKE